MDLIPSFLSAYTLEGYLTKITTRSKIIYWILIISVIVLFILLPFIKVDVTVLARGYFQSDIVKQVINAPFSGRVTMSLVRNGQKVKKGDTLLIIASETIHAQQESLSQKIRENDLSLKDLRILTLIESDEILSEKKDDLLSHRYISEFANFEKQHFIQLQKYQKTETAHSRNKILFEQKLIPDAEYENSLFSFNEEKETLSHIILNQKAGWESDLARRIIDSVQLKAELKQCTEELANRIVIAPLDGEIIQSSDIQEGSIVSASQMIAEISPDGELLATCFIRPGDIGLIYKNQPAVFQIDAFNYNEWGTLKGSICEISDDMISDNNSAVFFRVRCKLYGKTLTLNNGYGADVKKGMSLTARFLVTRRSLFNLLFDKADKWFNPYLKSEKIIANAD